MHDWEIIGARDPFFGVLASDEYRLASFDASARERFYASGSATVTEILKSFDAEFGARPSQGVALDIGCGVGRLTFAMAGVVPHVIGYDVAEAMLRIAREKAPANASFTTQLPDGPFGWVNTLIVFQHIPPPEGLALLRAALDRLAPGGFASIQVTAWTTGSPQQDGMFARLRRLRNRQFHRRAGRNVQPLIRMYDYNLSDVVRQFAECGIDRLVLRHTAHGDHHGVQIFGRR